MATNITVHPPQHLEHAREEQGRKKSLAAFHKCIFFLITMQGQLLQMNYTAPGDASPFVTHYYVMLTFIVTLLIYVTSLATLKLLKALDIANSEAGPSFLSNISLLTGTLATITPLLILVPVFGWLTFVWWAIYFVSVVPKLHQDFQTLYTIAVSQAFEVLDELMMNAHYFTEEELNGIP